VITDEAHISCINRDAACDITIKLTHPERTNLTVSGHSFIQAQKFIVDSPNTVLEIDDTSFISVSGGSYSTSGTSEDYNRGATFIG
jgi:hypothetical protein